MRRYLFRNDTGVVPPFTAYDIFNGVSYPLDEEVYMELTSKYKNPKYTNRNVLASEVLKKSDVPISNSPLKAEIHLTSRCNLACAHCFQSASPEVLKYGLLEPSAWKAVFDKLESSGIHRVTLSGGEPLIYGGINEILDDLTTRNFRVEILTNGLLINEKNIGLLSSSNIICSISLDGGHEKTHDNIRGKGTYRKLLKKFRLAQANKIKFNIAVTVTKTNYNEIKRLYDIAREYNAFSITFTFIKEIGRAKESNIALSKEECLEAFNVLEEIKDSRSPLVSYREEEVTMKLNRNAVINKNRSIYCNGGTKQIAIRSDGGTYPCIHAFEIDSLKLGNILTQSLEEIWNNDALDSFRGAIKLKDISRCNSCVNSDQCKENLTCRVKAYNETGSLTGHLSCI